MSETIIYSFQIVSFNSISMLNFVPLMGLSFGLMVWVESYRIFTIYGVFIFYIGIFGTEVFEIFLKD